MKIKKIAQEVFKIESEAIANLSNNLTDDFEKAVKDILACEGKLIVSGMGKSGIIGKKIAATMASTGTPSFFLHPAEAYHGDLGMIEADDIVLLLSNSGETDEVLKLIPFLKNQKNTIIAMSGKASSTLAKNSSYHLNISIDKEACPLQLAPTSSTTATLVMGDALAIALMKLRDFKDRDFAQFHPGGSLGRRLLTTVEDVMRSDNLPIVSKEHSIKSVISTVSEGRLGLAIVMEKREVLGIITDGDIRRAMEGQEDRFFSLIAKDLMTLSPKTVNSNQKIVDAQEIMAQFKVNSLLVLKDSNLVGVVQIYNISI